MRHTVRLFVIALVVFISGIGPATAQDAQLLRRPTLSHDQVAFAYAGDLWVVGRDGGRARRLTSTSAIETDPRFSPDGSLIAFTSTIGENSDVYVVPSKGGTPRRLTHHPGLDLVRGWTRDGQRVIFGSAREVLPTPYVSSYVRLWTVDLEGTMPQMLPMPRAYTGSLSPDGREIAYEEFCTEFETKEGQLQSAQWRHYRGGRTHPIRVMSLGDYSEKNLPWRDSNDSDPMWIGDTIYFVSDRDFTANIFAYHIASGALEQLTHHNDYDVMNASAGPDAIVYEQAGFVHVLDLRNRKAQRLHIQVAGDFPGAQPQTKAVAEMIRNAALSPNGERVAFEARGEIFIKSPGPKRALNLTQSSATHERNPAWSANGAQLAWLSDASGEYQLFIGGPRPDQRPRAIDLPVKGYFTTPIWSPDGRHLVLQDNQLTLWTIELSGGRATRIDAESYNDPEHHIDPVWSVDSRWIAYSRNLPNHLRAVFLYSLEQRKAYRITDPGVDAISPAFDRSGAYLYFMVSTDIGPSLDGATWIAMGAVDRPATRTVHAAVLRSGGAPPLALSEHRGVAGVVPGIDIEGLSTRIVPLAIPGGDYAGLIAGPPGMFFYAAYETTGVARLLAAKSLSVQRYDTRERKLDNFLKGVDAYSISADATKLLYREAAGHTWSIARADRAANAQLIIDSGSAACAERTTNVRDVAIDTSGLSMHVDPRREWAHIFREAWRTQRDDFYQPTMHGADWDAIYRKYLPFLPHVNHRADLGYVLAMVGGELGVGHSALTRAGDVPHDEPIPVGLLGADYAVDHGLYRIQRIYRGDPWRAELQAPLAEPGVGIKEGEYLFEVNGKPVAPPTEIYAPFEGTAGKPTQLRVGPSPEASASRLITIVPVADEEPLRTYEDWTEKNRSLVEKLSGGRVGYVWLSNVGPQGYQEFNRQFYAQLDKESLIIDERYNQGGYIPDYIVDALMRPLFGHVALRSGATYPLPMAASRGAKVMLINESAGSGGDALPYYFRLRQAGPLIGTRTWGGLVGLTAPTAVPPETLDGGGITAPNAAFYDRQGRWIAENEGIAPDIEVRNTPAAVIAGRDPQLERAVEEALKLLASHPEPPVSSPAPPDRVSRPR